MNVAVDRHAMGKVCMDMRNESDIYILPEIPDKLESTAQSGNKLN